MRQILTERQVIFMPLTPALCMSKIMTLIEQRKVVLNNALANAISITPLIKSQLLNEIEFNAQIAAAFANIVRGKKVAPSEFYWRSVFGASGDYILKLIGDEIINTGYKIHRAGQIKSTKAKPFDYMEEVNKLSSDILALKDCKRWWRKTLKEMEEAIIEDPTDGAHLDESN